MSNGIGPDNLFYTHDAYNAVVTERDRYKKALEEVRNWEQPNDWHTFDWEFDVLMKKVDNALEGGDE